MMRQTLTQIARKAAAAQVVAGPSRTFIGSSSARRTPISRAAPILLSKRFASTDKSIPLIDDPTEHSAMLALEDGNNRLNEGDIEGARTHYQKSVDIKPTASACFNLGVAEYHLQNTQAAIVAWKQALEFQPDSPDGHMNLASAYILSNPPEPGLAIRHLKQALELAPEDPEICFNLAAVLESTGNLQSSLKLYQKAVTLGIDRAEQNVRNVSAKILAQSEGKKDE